MPDSMTSVDATIDICSTWSTSSQVTPTRIARFACSCHGDQQDVSSRYLIMRYNCMHIFYQGRGPVTYIERFLISGVSYIETPLYVQLARDDYRNASSP